jgi:hypothetical protein
VTSYVSGPSPRSIVTWFGRELRVRGAELAELMRRPVGIGNREALTPEKEADLYLERRRARAAKRG